MPAVDPFSGEIMIVSFNFPPKGWAFCNGQLLQINQNQALFSLLGTTYGGNGQTTFGLPDLRGRIPMHFGNAHTQGERAGEEFHTLSSSELPAHNHLVHASGDAPNVKTPLSNFFASNTGFKPYGTPVNETMNVANCSSVGGSQAHENRSPYLVLNYCICLSGVFPSRN